MVSHFSGFEQRKDDLTADRVSSVRLVELLLFELRGIM
jgi:hypothetical protein